jgi:hypothetical protein
LNGTAEGGGDPTMSILLNLMNSSSEFALASEQKRKNDALPHCQSITENNSNLAGHIPQATLLIEELEESEVARFNTDLFPGRWIVDDEISFKTTVTNNYSFLFSLKTIIK